ETGIINNDGFGNTETITGPGRVTEIRTTQENDIIVGSALDDRFIPMAGIDQIDGGDGIDLVRYDRTGVEKVTFVSGVATGIWRGQNFEHTLINIERVRGSRDFGDELTGDALNDSFEGRGGDDTLIGLGGDDQLFGDDGNDSIVGGDGGDALHGGDGNDVLDASGGAVSTQEFGDFVQPGLGSDIVIGHEAVFQAGSGVSLSYGDVDGLGGVTITSGPDGSGTVSGAGGQINDTFTFAIGFTGSTGDDVFIGSNDGHFEWFSGLAGADSFNGGGGQNQVNYDVELDYYGGLGSGINVDILNGEIVDTQGSIDTITGINDVFGTDLDDTMTAAGTTDSITFYGSDGNDRLEGGSSFDYLEGGVGVDTLIGGAGDDFLVIEFGVDDSVDGGADRDVLFFQDLGSFDFRGVNVASIYEGSEVLNMENGGSDTLTLTLQSVFDFSDTADRLLDNFFGASPDNTITIRGDVGDILRFDASGGESFTEIDQLQDEDGEDLRAFEYTDNAGIVAIVAVDDDVAVQAVS
ncbi:MAG: calcium-binding protein, partial [Pseudomonadota bacterium]